MHIILTGATGTVGSPVLRQCLASPAVTRVSILSRRQFTLPTSDGLDTQKAEIIVHNDFGAYPASVTDRLQGANACVWALGVNTSDVSKEDYIRITYDYPVAAAKAFNNLNSKFNFVFVSGEGADPTEKTMTFFGKIKGRAEAALCALPPSHSALRIFNVRPGFVDPSPHSPKPASTMKRIGLGILSPTLRTVMPNMVSPADTLAKVLVDLATGDGSPIPAGPGIEDEGRTVRSVGIRKLGGI
ncbi:hypothetical protein DFH08DRAFT_285453 [Mycena albidolilacea]|uniref:NAD(P)-binding domain-containing protein n=1 Tax=Mycena albidolilacea TaxID=1033008 RepID=A0AAD7EL28_9AGAR|nr:hypothetical protein DFH08DRAFT_285453 [Mycena albidolilacea]